MKFSQFKPKDEQPSKKQENSQDKKVEDLFNTYKDMDSNQLMQELLKTVQKSKQDGSFDFDKLSQNIKQILPYLSQEQQSSVMTILSQIK